MRTVQGRRLKGIIQHAKPQVNSVAGIEGKLVQVHKLNHVFSASNKKSLPTSLKAELFEHPAHAAEYLCVTAFLGSLFHAVT